MTRRRRGGVVLVPVAACDGIAGVLNCRAEFRLAGLARLVHYLDEHLADRTLCVFQFVNAFAVFKGASIETSLFSCSVVNAMIELY